jgi:hypothetical protein
MPPSAIIGTPLSLRASWTFWMAVICGTPTPATMRVVQIEPGPMPTLTPSAPWSSIASAASAVAILPPITSTIGKFFLIHLTRSSTPLRMAVRGIDDQDIDARFGEQFDAFLGAGADADGGADPQAAGSVLAGVRVFGGLDDVLDGDQAAQFEGVVDHHHAFEPVLVDHRLAFLDRGSLHAPSPGDRAAS